MNELLKEKDPKIAELLLKLFDQSTHLYENKINRLVEIIRESESYNNELKQNLQYIDCINNDFKEQALDNQDY